MLDIKPQILKSTTIQLEPLNESHKLELYDAAQHEAIWTITASTAYGDQFYSWFDKAIKHFNMMQHIPFAVRRLSDNKIVGSTRYYDIYPEHHRLSIGHTWYVPGVWGTSVNPECKLLLLQFCFEQADVNRVEFSIDLRNLHSQAAVKKPGAKQEGILRQHMLLKNNYIRDSVVFSIIKPEWPEVKLNLQTRIDNLMIQTNHD